MGSPARTVGSPSSVPPREEMYDGGAAGAAERVGEPDLRLVDLAAAALAAELAHDLHRLCDAGRSDGIAARLQAAGRVHADLRVERGLPVLRREAALALRDEPEVLHRHDLRDREAVVDLGHLHVVR